MAAIPRIITSTFLLLALSVGQAGAFNPSITSTVNPANPQVQPKLEFLKNFQGKNQIKLLNNRFRVDYEVDEVTMLFFRKHGSAPVVLVRPDGSKIYPQHADGTTIEWHADVNYDLIKLKAPMAGPWQALGRILPESKILVLSDVELQVEEFPSQVFQFEKIKSSAKIVNANEMITANGFRDVVTLRASLYSTNNSDSDNFASDIYRLGEFRDNGKELDEKPGDGIFTVSYYINTVTGGWLPKYRVEAELFTRELEQDPIEVLPNPISFEARIADPGERYHYVDIVIDDTYLKPETLLFQGSIRFPNGEIQTYNLAEIDPRMLEIFQNDYGAYRISTEVYGYDKAGRDFTLMLPEFEFISMEPDIESMIPDEMSPEQMAMEQSQQEVAVEPEEESVPVLLIVIINLVLLILGFLVIWLFVLNKDIPNPLNLIKRKKKPEGDAQETDSKQEKVDKKAPDDQSSDDILDLSLPED